MAASLKTLKSKATMKSSRSSQGGGAQPGFLTKSKAVINIADDEKENSAMPTVSNIIQQERVSPIIFDEFYPWFCAKLGLLDKIVIIKHLQEEYVPVKKRLEKVKVKKIELEQSEKTLKTSRSVGHTHPWSFKTEERIVSEVPFTLRTGDVTIPVHAYYVPTGFLTELLIKDTNRLAVGYIKSMNYFIPYHQWFTKLTITRCSITQEAVYQLGQLLPGSNIEELCLDGCWCKQCNYYYLLEYPSKLKVLSLNRCNVGDVIVKEIFTRIRAGEANTLQVLELSTNTITDEGAYEIGCTLRKNRTLLHLNLAGNRITDTGAEYILNPLMKFQLNEEEIKEKLNKNVMYAKRKANIYLNVYQDQLRRRIHNMQTLTGKKDDLSRKKSTIFAKDDEPRKKSTVASGLSRKSRTPTATSDIKVITEKLTMQLIGGPFRDVFDKEHVITENGVEYCTGNFVLSSLNLAYNCVQYLGLKKIAQVLKYQTDTPAPSDCSAAHPGLVRMVFDGNQVPHRSDEFISIGFYLAKKTGQDKSTSRNLGQQRRKPKS